MLLAVPSTFDKYVYSAKYNFCYNWYGYYALISTVVAVGRLLRFESGAPISPDRASSMLSLPIVGNQKTILRSPAIP
jgi:hypothetical protein